MAWYLGRWVTNPGVLNCKRLGGSKVGSAFYLSEADQMSTRNFWGLDNEK